jgi:hypothetical protein
MPHSEACSSHLLCPCLDSIEVPHHDCFSHLRLQGGSATSLKECRSLARRSWDLSERSGRKPDDDACPKPPPFVAIASQPSNGEVRWIPVVRRSDALEDRPRLVPRTMRHPWRGHNPTARDGWWRWQSSRVHRSNAVKAAEVKKGATRDDSRAPFECRRAGAAQSPQFG